MIILGVVFLYIGLSEELPAAKVKPTGYQTVKDRKLFTRYSENFYFDSCNIFSLTLTYNAGLTTQ